MAGFVPTPDGVYRIDHIFSWAGKHASVGYYKQMGGASLGGLDSILDHFAASFHTNVFLTIMNGPITLIEHTLRDTGVSDGGVTVRTTTAHTGATSNPTGAIHPYEVAAVASLRSGLIGRSRRGRMYIPGILDSSFDSSTGLWTTGFTAAVTADLATWMSDSNSIVSGFVNSSQFVIASRQINGVPQNPRHITPVLSMICNPAPCSQRRRQPQHHGRLR